VKDGIEKGPEKGRKKWRDRGNEGERRKTRKKRDRRGERRGREARDRDNNRDFEYCTYYLAQVTYHYGMRTDAISHLKGTVSRKSWRVKGMER
jgi:hypothetical protein